MDQQGTPYRPRPTFSQQSSFVNAVTPLPSKVDLNGVDSNFRDIYAAYNQRIDQLSANLGAIQNQATAAQGDVQKSYDLSVQDAEGAYNNTVNSLRDANQDAQLSNRVRARAVGGAPSSGFLDLANRTDIQTQKGLASAGSDLSRSYSVADQSASKALTDIMTALQGAIMQIQSNASASLLEKDQAIRQVRERAAALAAQRVQETWGDLGLTVEEDGANLTNQDVNDVRAGMGNIGIQPTNSGGVLGAGTTSAAQRAEQIAAYIRANNGQMTNGFPGKYRNIPVIGSK